MDITIGVLLAVGAYLLGSVSPSYLLVRLTTGEDVRQLRSRNAGTLNTYHRLGLRGGLAVLVLDAGKGALAVLAPSLVNAPEWTVFVTAPLVLIGHNWPVFLKFRGGKGAAVLLGVSLGLFPIVTAVCLVPIALVMLLLRNVVVGAGAGYVLVCLALIVTGTEWPFYLAEHPARPAGWGHVSFRISATNKDTGRGRSMARPAAVAIPGRLISESGQELRS